MAKTHLDEMVKYPALVLQAISDDATCVGLIVNKSPDAITDADKDEALDKYLFDYQYVDQTSDSASAYVWVETDIDRVDNRTIKSMSLYVTIACHKQYMKLDNARFAGMMGNRRDNLVRYIDKILNQSNMFGIGALSLSSVNTQISSNGGYTIREIKYEIPDFNIKQVLD